MPAAAWTIPCAHRLWEVGLQVQTIQTRHAPKQRMGRRCWTRTADISKTGTKYIRGDRTLSSYESSYRAVRGSNSARYWSNGYATTSNSHLGFRPVLEVLNPDTLGSDGLKVVTLDLGGGKLGGSSDDIQIIVKNGERFTAPASGGMTRPDGNTGSYFMWLGSDGKLYAPGANVPADVTKLTAQFVIT